MTTIAFNPPEGLKMLFLDDDDKRHEFFARTYKKHVCTHAYSFEDFEIKLNAGVFDVIWLDHDLGDFPKVHAPTVIGGMYGGGEQELTGLDAALLVAKLPEERRPQMVVVHSWNVPGSMRIRRALETTGIKVVVRQFDPDI